MNEKWLTIRMAKNNEAVIDIDGDIGEGWFSDGGNTTKSIKAQLKEIANLKAKTITVNINSLGGSVTHGLGIHDALAQHDAEIITNINGLTASAATIIAMSGDKRRMSDNALFLIHQAMIMSGGNINRLEEDLQDLKKVNDRLVNIYVKRTGHNETEIRELMDENDGHGKWIDADEAEDSGYIDEVFEPMGVAATKAINKEYFNKNKFPNLPQNYKTMNEVKKKAATSVEDTAEEKTNFINAILDGVKKIVKPAAKVEPEPKKEPEKAKVEPEKAKTVPDPEPEDKSEEMQTEIDRLSGELAEANSKLAQADAGSTIIEGKVGKEGDRIELTAEEKMLQEDVKKIDDKMDFVK